MSGSSVLEPGATAVTGGVSRRAMRGAREPTRWRAYRKTFRRHPLRFSLPVLLALMLAAWIIAGASPSYQSTSSIWVDNAAPMGSSLDPLLAQAIEPADEAQIVFDELLTTRGFLNAVGAQSGLSHYLATHATAGGFGPAELVSRLAGRSGSSQQRLDTQLGPNVTAVVEGPEVLRISFTGPTPAIARSTLRTLTADLPVYARRYGASYAGIEANYYEQVVRAESQELASAQWQASNFLAVHSRVVARSGLSPYQSLSSAASSYSSRLAEATASLAQARSAVGSDADGLNLHVIDAASLSASPITSTKSEIETTLVFLALGLAAVLLILAVRTPGGLGPWSQSMSAKVQPSLDLWAVGEGRVPAQWATLGPPTAYPPGVSLLLPGPAEAGRASSQGGITVPSRRRKAARRTFTLPEPSWRGVAPTGRSAVAGTTAARDLPQASQEPRSVIGRNLGALAGGQLITWSMTLIWTLVVPRVLGPAGLGYIVSAISVSSVFGIVLGLGTKAYLVREIVVDREAAPQLIGSTIVLRAMLAPLVAIGVVVFAHLAHYGQEARAVLYLATAMTILALLTEPLQAGFQAIERMQYLAYADVINKTAQSLVGITLVFLGFRAEGIMTVMMLAAGVVLALNYNWLRRFLWIDLRADWKMIWKVVRQSLAYWVGGTFSMIYLWIDTVMLSLMTTARVVGWYGATTTLFQTVMFIPVLISTAWLPRLVRAAERGRGQLMAEAHIPFEITLCTGIPIAAGTALCAPLVVHTFYGAQYAHAVPVLIVLAACLPWIYLNIILYAVLVALKRAFEWTFVMLGAAIVNPLFNLVLIRVAQNRLHNGAIGAAASLTLTELIMDLVALTMIGRDLFTAAMIRRCLAAAVSSAGMLATGYLLVGLGQLVAVAAGVGVMVVLSLVLRVVTPAELAIARSRVPGLAGRLVGRRRSGVAAARV
jgi:O-antigen/teichoic acid export membrane protein